MFNTIRKPHSFSFKMHASVHKFLDIITIIMLLMCVLSSSSSEKVVTECDPAEIGTNHSIKCSSSDVKGSIAWTRLLQQTESLLYECPINSTECVRSPSLNLNNMYYGHIEYVNGIYSSKLFIYNIRVGSELIFKCSIDRQPFNVCNPLQIFSKPEGVQCNENLKIQDNNLTSVICFITNVYPAAKMSITYTYFNKTDICKNDTSSFSRLVRCQIDISITDLKADINYISVLIYPDVVKGEKYGVKMQLNVSLSFPTPSLSQDCQNISNTTFGYIKQGTSANCTCYVKIQGVPTGGVGWYLSNGTKAGSICDKQSATIQVKFEGKEPYKNYTCVGVSELGRNTSGVGFSIKNAFGPEHLQLFINHKISVNNICTNDTNLNISCILSMQDVAPEPRVHLSVSDAESLLTDSNKNSTHYIYMSSYTLKGAGDLNFKCEAINYYFHELKTVVYYRISIAGPPTQPPILNIRQQIFSGNSGNTVKSQKEGSNIEITCQVSGGFPNTYNMTVSCDGSYNNSATNSDVVKLSIENVGRQLNGKLCVCKAEHVTSCYVNNTSSVTLNITYIAEIDTFTANSIKSEITVPENTDVTFICNVESNPSATVELTKTEAIIITRDKVNFTKHVTCEDSGNYFCKAHNSECIQPIQSSILLYVRCTLQLRNDDDNNKVFSAKNGMSAFIHFDVFGYPEPISYSLWKRENANDYKQKNTSEVDSVKSRYQFKYVPDILPFGMVQVIIFKLTEEDFTSYILIISNGMDDAGLKLGFSLEEDNADILPASIGGGFAAFVLIAVMIVILICKGNFYKRMRKKLKYFRNMLYAEREQENGDIYIFTSKDTTDIKKNFKNYFEVSTTITTATAVPKNIKFDGYIERH